MTLALRLFSLLLTASIGLAACAPIALTPAAPDLATSTAAAARASSTVGAPTDTPPPAVTPDPEPTLALEATPPAGRPGLATVPPTAEPMVEALPVDLEARLRADVEARAGLPATALRLIRAEAVTWPDGSLGCPQPGMFYTQALEEGYWVVWQAEDGRQFDYRATQRGSFIWCAKLGRVIGEELPATVLPISP